VATVRQIGFLRIAGCLGACRLPGPGTLDSHFNAEPGKVRANEAGPYSSYAQGFFAGEMMRGGADWPVDGEAKAFQTGFGLRVSTSIHQVGGASGHGKKHASKLQAPFLLLLNYEVWRLAF